MPAIMKYYYLNEDKKPQGPYSEAELVAFKQSGMINEDTLAAAAGDSRWQRLEDLLNKETAEECSTWNKEEVIRRRGDSPRKKCVGWNQWTFYLAGQIKSQEILLYV